jgi:hypothetical protein
MNKLLACKPPAGTSLARALKSSSSNFRSRNPLSSSAKLGGGRHDSSFQLPFFSQLSLKTPKILVGLICHPSIYPLLKTCQFLRGGKPLKTGPTSDPEASLLASTYRNQPLSSGNEKQQVERPPFSSRFEKHQPFLRDLTCPLISLCSKRIRIPPSP